MTSTITTLLILAIASHAAVTVVTGCQFTSTLFVSQDVTLERGSSNFNYLQYLLVGKHPGFPNKRSLLQFPNPSSNCARVVSAQLFLYFVYAHKASYMSNTQVPTFSRTVVAHRVLKSWSESQATTTRRFSNAYWSQPWLQLGSDALAQPTSAGVVVQPSQSRNHFVAIDVTSAVRDWKNGQPNYGLLIRATNENTLGRDFRFASNAHTDSGKHAFIQVRCDFN